MPRCTCLKVLLLLLLFSSTVSYGQHKILKTFSARTFYEDNGLLSNNIYAAAQHSNGEMWFGTSKGISTFDGLRWKSLHGSSDFPFHHRSMLVSLPGDSMLQLGVKNSSTIAIRLYHQSQATDLGIFPIKPQIDGQRVFNAAVQQDGSQFQLTLQIEAYLWIYKSTSRKWQKVAFPEDLTASEITKLVYFKDALIIATTHGLYSFHQNTGKFQQLWPSLLENKTILAATPSPDGEKLYLLGNNWVAEWHNNRLRFLVDKLFEQESPFARTYNYNITTTKAGLLVFQVHHALFLLNPDTGFLEPFRLTNSFATTTPSTILEDSEQNLWFTTLRGIVLLNSLRFATMDKVVGLPDSEISTIFELDSGSVLLGSNLGINILKDYRWQKQAKGDQLYSHNNYRIMDAQRVNDRQVVIAGNSQGIGLLNEDFRTDWYELPNDQLAAAVGLWGDTIIVGTDHGKLLSFKNGSFSTLIDLQRNLYIRKIKEDKQGNLLILTAQGLYLYNGHKTVRLSSKKEQPDNLYSLCEWNGRTLLGTAHGVFELRDRQLYSLKDSIPVERPVYALLVDKKGRLWMGADKGVYIYHKNSLINFNRFNGLSGQEINRSALAEMKDGRIWIGTDRGVSIYDPHYDFERTVIPGLQIKEIKTHEQQLTGLEDHRLDADQNMLEFTFQAMSYYYPEGIQYRYRLEGLEKDWTYSENYLQNNIRYNSLPAGKYRFAIEARVQDGPWSPTQHSSSITITPPFYNTWWFLAMIMLGIGLIGYVTHSVITQRSNEKELKNAIQEKILQIEASESKFQAIWESMDTAVAIVGKDARILMANPSFLNLFSQQGKSLVGTEITSLLAHSRFSPQSIASWYTNPLTSHFEIELQHTDTPLFLLSTFTHLHRFKAGEPLLLIGLKNISNQKEAEIKNLRLNELLVRQNRDLIKKELELATFNMELLKRQEELQAALGILEERNFELDQFVYKTSHDLRAPIASSIGLLNVMKMEGLSPSWPGYLDMIMRSLQKQDSFIKAMLNFSKTARAVEKPEPIVLKKLIEQCLKDLQFLPGFDEIRKRITANTCKDCFYSDRMKVHIILSNIISNSIKYRDATKDSRLDISIETNAQWAQIQISDNGIGINKDYLKHIFDMFYRATERSDGSGLGLYIVKQTIERLGGKIEVNSELGVGSCFKIRIPNLLAKAVAEEEKQSSEEVLVSAAKLPADSAPNASPEAGNGWSSFS